MILGDTHIITTLYLMVVTCGNGNFKLPHSNSAKFPSFFSLAKTSLLRKFFRDFAHENIFSVFKMKFSFCFQNEIFYSVIVLYIYSSVNQNFLREIFVVFLRFLSYRGGIWGVSMGGMYLTVFDGLYSATIF